MKDRSLLDEMRAAVRGDLERSGVRLGRKPDNEPAGEVAPAEEVAEEPTALPSEPQAATEQEPEPAPEPEPAAAEEPRPGILARLFRRR